MKLETELARIEELTKRRPRIKLQTLVHLVNEQTLKECHNELESGKAAGIDQMTKEEYGRNLEDNIRNLVDRMKRQAYKPQPAKRVYIPKEGNGKTRALGIPAYEDKLVQKCMSKILNAIYETEFLDCSYGFRPGRSCHDALRELDSIIGHKKVRYVVDADIKGFFDNVNHEWMMKFLKERIEDPNMLRLTARFLKAGVIEDGKAYETDTGTPQGGVISPILANVYLHYVLDLWFEHKVKPECKGEAYLIRYADDFVCCFQLEEDAEKFYRELVIRMKQFSLDIAEEKTKIIEFGRIAEENRKERGEGKPETFDFLGFTHYCGRTRAGKFALKRKTSRKKFKAKLKKSKAWLKQHMHDPVKELIKKLNKKLVGHYRYYGVSDNYKMINSFKDKVMRQMYRVLRRRGQRKRINWEKYKILLNRYPLAKPKIYVRLYA